MLNITRHKVVTCYKCRKCLGTVLVFQESTCKCFDYLMVIDYIVITLCILHNFKSFDGNLKLAKICRSIYKF